MSSLFGSMAGATANAMEGAAIGRAIGNANDRAEHAEAQLDLWYKHAKMLEGKVLGLQEQLRLSEAANVKLAQQLASKEHELVDFKKVAKGAFRNASAGWAENADYAKKVKERLSQMQSGLKQSSADVASLSFMLNLYTELFGDFSQLLSKGSIDDATKAAAEAVWLTFMQGDKLTNNPEIQQLIDQAPMPMKTSRVTI